MKKLVILCFGLSLSTWANAQKVISNAGGGASTSWAVLSDTSFAIHYPKEWALDQSGLLGSNFFLYSTLDSLDDAFRENFNLTINDLSEYPGLSLKEMAEGARQQILAMINEVKILEFREMEQGDDNYYLVEFTGKQGEALLHWKQQYRMAANRFYVLTFTAERHQFSRYISLADQIFSTFFLK